MKCTNCGARLSEGANVCFNCGARVDNNDEYVLLTSDEKMFDIYADTPPDEKKKKKKSKKGGGFVWFLSIVLTLVIIGGGAYYYFINIYSPSSNQPELTFEGGAGIINDDEEIVYVLLKPDSKIEYIHGVSIYDYDKTDKSAGDTEAVSTNYEYTKSIDETFRAIFFDVEGINTKKGNNVYTFEMKFSFYDSDDIYTYLQPVTFNSSEKSDVSDLIFDHSTSDEATTSESSDTDNDEEETTAAEQTTELSPEEYTFIYDYCWYTEPIHNGEEYSISSLKLTDNNTYHSTSYFKDGTSSKWQKTNANGRYTIENGYVVIDNGEATESTYYKIDAENKSLYEEEDGNKVSALNKRKYNSVDTVERFFKD